MCSLHTAHESDSALPASSFDVEQFPHKEYLYRGGEHNHQYLKHGPLPHIGVIVQDNGVVSRFVVPRVSLILEHCVQIALYRRYCIREVVHVHIEILNFLCELFPFLIPDNGDVQVNQFTGESRKLVINAHGIEASHCGPVRVVARCLPLVRVNDFPSWIANRKPGHAITAADNVKADIQRATLLNVLVVTVFLPGIDVHLVVHRNSW